MRAPETDSSVPPSSIAVVNKHAGHKPAGDSACKVAPQVSQISRAAPVAIIKTPVAPRAQTRSAACAARRPPRAVRSPSVRSRAEPQLRIAVASGRSASLLRPDQDSSGPLLPDNWRAASFLQEKATAL